ncbi:unnamed protein product [Parajaminaea phylloscopi]
MHPMQGTSNFSPHSLTRPSPPHSAQHLYAATAMAATSGSPASEIYPPSSSSSSRHTSASSLPIPAFASNTTQGAPYGDVFDPSDREDEVGSKLSTLPARDPLPYGSTSQFPDVPSGQSGMSLANAPDTLGPENWYDPAGADTYALAQVFRADDQAGIALPLQTYFSPSQQHEHQSSLGSAHATDPATSSGPFSFVSTQAFRELPQHADGLVPSPFASPATSHHHRGHSFGSMGSSPSLFSPSPSAPQDPQQQQQQQQQHQWYHGDVNGLQRMQSITLDDGQHSQQQQMQLLPDTAYPDPAASSPGQNASLTTSFQNQPGSEANPLAAGSQTFPDESLEQLIAQHQHQQQQRHLQDSQHGYQSQQIATLPVIDVLPTAEPPSMFGGDEVSFEQVLQSIGEAPQQNPGQMPTSPRGMSKQDMLTANFAGAAGSHTGSQSPLSWPQGPAAESPGDARTRWGANDSVSHLSVPRPQPPQIAVRKPTREDSMDKLKKFLKLDVNMAYTGPQDDSPTTSFMRKRSASDAGPAGAATVSAAAPVGDAPAWALAGGVARTGHFAEALNPPPLAATLSSSELSSAWQFSEQPAASSSVLQQQSGRVADEQDVALQNGLSGLPDSTTQASHYARQNTLAADVGGVGPMRSGGVASAARDGGAGSPYGPPRSVSAGSRRASQVGPGYVAEGWATTNDFLSPQAANDLPAWSFPGGPPGSPGSVRRSQSTRGGARALSTHRRTAQSEDLSHHSAALDALDASRCFTAPDGTLMPPGYFFPVPGSAGTSSGRTTPVHTPSAYSDGPSTHSQGHPPASSGLSYASLSGTSSAGPSATSPGFASPKSNASSPTTYSQTALPTYTSLAPSRRRISSNSSLPGGVSAATLANPPVQNVTTSATQAASASRRKNDAQFVCPVPGCGSQFTRQFNLRSHLRSHADERPFKCPAPGCDKAFARAHDAKRHHETLHLSVKKHVCEHCQRQFARLDALHRHLKPESGGCSERASASAGEASDDGDNGHRPSEDESRDAAGVRSMVSGNEGLATNRGGDDGGNGGGGFAGHVL